MIPVDATPNFTLYNNWHAGVARVGSDALIEDLSGLINNVCEDDCDRGQLTVTFQVNNLSERDFEGLIQVSFYAIVGGAPLLLDTVDVDLSLESARSTEGINAVIAAPDGVDASGILMRVDDDGTGTGWLSECSELDNVDRWSVAICDG